MQDVNILEELFYSTEIWGYGGVLLIILIGYLAMKKDKNIGLMYSVIVAIAGVTYFEKFLVDPAYIWHAVIVIFGWLFICVYQFFDR